MRRALLLLVVLAGFVAGCESKYKDPDPQAMGYDYYPLEVGNYRVYDVTDIRFRFNEGDTARFQLREVVDTSFYDQTNQLVYKIIRSKRLNESLPWVEDSVMTVNRNETRLLLTKDNTKYVKLVFPVKENKKWEVDAFNSRILKDPERNISEYKEQYFYSNVGAPLQMNGKDYANTATVTPLASSNANQIDERSEIYAQGVGLVHRIFNRVNLSPCGPGSCPNGENYKLEGHERHEVLIEHGKL